MNRTLQEIPSLRLLMAMTRIGMPMMGATLKP